MRPLLMLILDGGALGAAALAATAALVEWARTGSVATFAWLTALALVAWWRWRRPRRGVAALGLTIALLGPAGLPTIAFFAALGLCATALRLALAHWRMS